jgi:hypothetical protein
MIQAHPELLTHVFELDRARMHVIGPALAHFKGDPKPELASVLIRGRTGEVLVRVLGRCPDGINRPLCRLPFSMLSQQGYLDLINLLDDPGSAKLLHHFQETEITDAIVRMLCNIPAALRPIVAGVIALSDSVEHLPEGLRWLAARGAATDYDALIVDLAAQAQPGQFVARLRDLVSALPLPETLPPERIGQARRIDATTDIRALGLAFKNCLANYTTQVDAGACAIYLWEDREVPAVCRVSRHGRLGWGLSETLGPRNTELSREDFRQVCATFAQAGVPRSSVMYALESILHANTMMRARSRRQQQDDRENPLLELSGSLGLGCAGVIQHLTPWN